MFDLRWSFWNNSVRSKEFRLFSGKQLRRWWHSRKTYSTLFRHILRQSWRRPKSMPNSADTNYYYLRCRHFHGPNCSLELRLSIFDEHSLMSRLEPAIEALTINLIQSINFDIKNSVESKKIPVWRNCEQLYREWTRYKRGFRTFRAKCLHTEWNPCYCREDYGQCLKRLSRNRLARNRLQN